MTGSWHDDDHRRKAVGDAYEDLFERQVRCACGGKFKRIGHLRPGFPDFTCEDCGQLVDVKGSPQAERTGRLSVSAVPWDHYPADMMLATCIRGRWLGNWKANICPVSRTPRAATHRAPGRLYKNTKFYLISWRGFRSLADFGFRCAGAGSP